MSERADRAAAMRAAFDRSFAEPATPVAAAHEALLAVRIGGQARAIALADIRAIHVDRRLATVPGPQPALLGLAAVRGVIVPVWDLRALLGAPRTEPPRWLVLAAHANVAFAFDTFEGHLHVAKDAIAAGPVRVVEIDGVPRALISLAGLLDELGRRAGPTRTET
jgi:chemotaxis signal transduction protein